MLHLLRALWQVAWPDPVGWAICPSALLAPADPIRMGIHGLLPKSRRITPWRAAVIRVIFAENTSRPPIFRYIRSQIAHWAKLFCVPIGKVWETMP